MDELKCNPEHIKLFKRIEAYPEIGELADALVKDNQDTKKGEPLILGAELKIYIQDCLKAKEKNPL